MVVLTAYCSVLSDKIDAALAAFKTVREPSIREAGCEIYNYFQSPTDPTQFVFVEEWTSKADLDAHFETPWFKAFAGSFGEFVSAPPVIKIFEATKYE